MAEQHTTVGQASLPQIDVSADGARRLLEILREDGEPDLYVRLVAAPG
jgi:hypothetical protein